MADLDKYLENIGISTHDDDTQAQPALSEFGNELGNEFGADFGNGLGHKDSKNSNPLIGRANHFVPLEGNARQRCEQLLVHILLHIDPAYAVNVQETHEEDDVQLHATITGGDVGRLIGKNGRTLAALEYIVYIIVNNEEEKNIRVHLDAGNYRERQADRLRHIATQAANRVRKTGFAVELDPMSPAERRLIHMVIADEVGVLSESSGEGRGRRVVVKPA